MLFMEGIIPAKFAIPKNPEEYLAMLVRLGENNPALLVLIMLMVIDVVTGILASWICKEISSATSYKGMVRKVIMLALVAAARVMETVMPNAPLMTLGCIGFSCTELFSIVENAGRAGVPLPASLKVAFERFKDKDKETKKTRPLVEVNTESVTMEHSPPKRDRPSDVVINVQDGGEIESGGLKGDAQ